MSDKGFIWNRDKSAETKCKWFIGVWSLQRAKDLLALADKAQKMENLLCELLEVNGATDSYYREKISRLVYEK